MIVTKIKKRVIVKQVDINQPERFKPFEIKLPANVKSVTGIQVTVSATWILAAP